MKITLLLVGKTASADIRNICADYTKRINHYTKMEELIIENSAVKVTSTQFANYLEGLFNQSIKNIIFIVGGAYGFSDALYKRANAKLSLSKMTFSHQIVRAIFAEQLYRAFTIIHNEPYHHE